jgi:hypothetical protein
MCYMSRPFHSSVAPTSQLITWFEYGVAVCSLCILKGLAEIGALSDCTLWTQRT